MPRGRTNSGELEEQVEENNNNNGSVSSDAQTIRISFTCQKGKTEYYEVAESVPIRNLIQSFCKKRNIEYATARFTCHHKKLPYRGTIAEAGLSDQDEILVYIDQTGA